MQTPHSLEFKSEMQHSFAEAAGKPHCGFRECRVWLNCPLNGVQMNSPISFSKVWSSNALPPLQSSTKVLTVIPKNAKSTWIPHPVFTKCGACLNSPLCFCNTWSLNEFPPLWVCLNFLFWFYKMQSSNELPTVVFKNVEFVSSPHSVFEKGGICLSSPLGVWKMRSSHKLPPLRSPLRLPSCFQKMRSSNELPTVILKNAEFVSTPHSICTKCAVHLNPPLSF